MKQKLSYLGLMAKLNLKYCALIMLAMAISEFAYFEFYLSKHYHLSTFYGLTQAFNSRWLSSIFLIFFLAIIVILLDSFRWRNNHQSTYTLYRLKLSKQNQLLLRVIYNFGVILLILAFQMMLIYGLYWRCVHAGNTMAITSVNFARLIYNSGFLILIMPINKFSIIVIKLTLFIVIAILLSINQVVKQRKSIMFFYLIPFQLTLVFIRDSDFTLYGFYLAFIIMSVSFLVYRKRRRVI